MTSAPGLLALTAALACAAFAAASGWSVRRGAARAARPRPRHVEERPLPARRRSAPPEHRRSTGRHLG